MIYLHNGNQYLMQALAGEAKMVDMLREVSFDCECGGRVGPINTLLKDLPSTHTGVPCSDCDKTYTVEIDR